MEPYQIATVTIAGIGVLIAGGGLWVSVISLHRSSSTQKEQSRLRRKQEELIEVQLDLRKREAELVSQGSSEIQSADVRVSLEGTPRRARFMIRNWGLGAARDVDLKVKPLDGCSSPMMENLADRKLPIPRLAPGGEVSLVVGLTFDTGTTFDVTWRWKSDDGKCREETSRVSL